ncbi:MAG: hypothetical protein LH631_01500 [Alkalinema sp. CAN_BIN05]|nr:hypothetical protein [Alkalinema sp. CAN_BIN05]
MTLLHCNDRRISNTRKSQISTVKLLIDRFVEFGIAAPIMIPAIAEIPRNALAGLPSSIVSKYRHF